MNATYRLQLTPEFGFAEIRELLPYFRRLGISHLYLSPINEARSGSTHGYDVIDHERIRDELGGRDGFEALLTAVREEGLALVLDFVPNHAGVGANNAAWQDVLAYGPHAEYASYFDIDWDPLKPELRNKVLLPFLGSPYGDALHAGELRLTYDDGRFYAAYYENRFALSPASYDAILAAALPGFERRDAYFDLKDLHDAYRDLRGEERAKAEALRTRLATLSEQVDFAPALEAFDAEAMHALLERQYWRLAYWKTASFEINYRRFFDINELVGLRMEVPEVFWDVHQLMGELVAKEGVEGLRIDHIDGLFDPGGYLDRLAELGAERVWVEKILARGETLPEAWNTAGTTGYAFMNDAMGVLTHAAGEPSLMRTYREQVDEVVPFAAETHRSKRLVMTTSLSGELFRLANDLARLAEADYRTRDLTFEALHEALAEIIAALPRYRTYLPDERAEADEVLRASIAQAKRRNPAFEPSAFDFIAEILVGEVSERLRERQRAFVGLFQQYTAPVAAKGVEDTAFYRYLPLAALNEVGGEPEPFGVEPQAFHARARFRAYRYPENLLATATHDHKRGEDTRMRLIVLAELHEQWHETVADLRAEAERYHASRADALVRPRSPSPNDAHLFAQLLVALWSDADRSRLEDRLVAYMQKAAREAKLHTSWLNPDADYEQGLEAYVRHMMGSEAVADAVSPLAASVARHGFTNTLSQTILKLTTPGVPDLYQGAELMDLSLVDPDNRGEVDYARRARLLDELQPLLDTPDPDRLAQGLQRRHASLKLYVVTRLLRFRREHASLFDGGYQPLACEGVAADHLLTFARDDGDESLLVAVPRFPAALEGAGSWGDTRIVVPEALRGGEWIDVLSGEVRAGQRELEPHGRGWPFAVLYRGS